MMRLKLTAGLIAAAALSACGTSGEFGQIAAYGDAKDRNEFTQIAYKDPSDRLRDLSIDFAAETMDTVNFAFDSSRLDGAARQALRGQAKWLKENEGVRMTIIGHTDLVGSERYNDGLGLRRARAALNFLVQQGVSRSRLEAIESLGESQPIVATEERERRNRRAVTTVAGFERAFVGDGLDGEVAARLYDNYQRGQISVSEADSGGVGG